ncbi:MAG: alpha/beta hydrolase [Planctomycetota bacterium]
MPDAFAPDESIVYKTASDAELPIHLFRPAAANGPTPAIVFFFGGGWAQGSPAQFFPQCRRLAERGMLAASAEYRVRTRHNVTPFECAADAKSAVRWMRAHAGELGIDPQRLAAGGGSAGGHLAAVAGLVADLDEPDEDAGVSSRPDALVLFNPVLDNGPDGFGHEAVKERWQEISPLHNVGAGAPPAIVFLGDADKIIPVATAEAFRDRMEAAGARCDLCIYPEQGHGFFNHRPEGNPHYELTMTEAERFLASLGYIAPA